MKTEAGLIRKGAFFALAVLLVMSTLSFLDRKALSLLVQPIRHDLRINDFEFSLVQGASFSLFYVLLSYPVGWMVDRFSRRWVIYGGVTVWSAATVASGLASSFPQILIARSLLGVGEASLGPAAYSLLADMFPKNRLGMAITVFGTGAMFGGVGAFFMGGAVTYLLRNSHGVALPLVGLLHPWQVVLVLMGALGLAFGPLIFSFREPMRVASPVARQAGGKVWAHLRARPVFYICLFIGAGSHALVASAGAFWGPAYMLRTFHWTIAQVGFTLALLSAFTGLIGMVGSGLLVDRLFSRGVRDAHLAVFSAYAAISTVTGVAAYLSSQPIVYLVLSSIHGMTSGIGGLAAATLTVACPAELRGRLSGLLVLVINLGTLGLAPSVVAFLTDYVFHGDAHVGWSLATVTGVFGPIAFVTLMLARRPMRRLVEEHEAEASEQDALTRTEVVERTSAVPQAT